MKFVKFVTLLVVLTLLHLLPAVAQEASNIELYKSLTNRYNLI